VPVAVEQPAHDPERHLERQVLEPVMEPVEQHTRPVGAVAQMGADLHRPDRATLPASADREQSGDPRMGGRRGDEGAA